MTTNPKHTIENLLASGKRIAVVECGSGTAVSAALLSVPGASKVVDAVFIPYSTESQDVFCKTSWLGNEVSFSKKIEPGEYKLRAVSMENVLRLMQGAIEHTTKKSAQLFYASTWQISGGIVHGWISVGTTTECQLWHITLPTEWQNKTRQEICDKISEIGLNAIIGYPVPYADDYQRITLDKDNKSNIAQYSTRIEYLVNNLESLGSDENGKLQDSIICVTPTGITRLVNYERSLADSDISIYRGSFNPLSEAHKNIANDTAAILMLGTHTYDKGVIPAKEITERVIAAIELGYTVFIQRGAMFVDTIKVLRDYGITKQIQFIIGSDTLKRIMEAGGVTTDFISNNKERHFNIDNLVMDVLKPYIDQNVELYIIDRKDRSGKSYKYELPISTSTEALHNQSLPIKYCTKVYDFPSSTELREQNMELSKKAELISEAACAMYDAYYASNKELSFKDFSKQYAMKTMQQQNG